MLTPMLQLFKKDKYTIAPGSLSYFDPDINPSAPYNNWARSYGISHGKDNFLTADIASMSRDDDGDGKCNGFSFAAQAGSTCSFDMYEGNQRLNLLSSADTTNGAYGSGVGANVYPGQIISYRIRCRVSDGTKVKATSYLTFMDSNNNITGYTSAVSKQSTDWDVIEYKNKEVPPNSNRFSVVVICTALAAGNTGWAQFRDIVVCNGTSTLNLQQDVDTLVVNQLGKAGNFENDSNGDGLADGLNIGASYGLYTLKDNVQSIEALTSATAREVYAQFRDADVPFSWNVGDKMYFCGLVKVIAGAGRLTLFNRDSNGDYIASASPLITNTNGQFVFVSVENTITSKYSIPRLYARATLTNAYGQAVFIGNGEKMEVAKFVVINKTAIWGKGNEPLKSDLDYYIQNKQYLNTAPYGVPDAHQNAIPAGNITITQGPKGLVYKMYGGKISIPNNSNTDILNLPTGKSLIHINAIYIDESSTGGYIYAQNEKSSDDVAIGYYFSDELKKIAVYAKGIQITSTPGGSIQKGKWYIVFVEWNGSQIKVYINGVLSATGSCNSPLPSKPFITYGARSNSSSGDGTIFLRGLFGIQAICLSTITEIFEWANRVKLYQRYSISA